MLLLLPTSLAAQYTSRAEEIQAARERKALDLQPDVPTSLEQTLVNIRERKILERLTAGIAGFRVKFGGLATGSGFAIGPEYLRRELADGNVVFRGSTRASAKRYLLHDLQLTLPKLAGDRVFVDLHAIHRNFPRMQYFGAGPDSIRTGRSNYRLEDTSFDAAAGVRLFDHVRIGAGGGYVLVNVGPGTDPRFVSTERTFTPATTPGIDHQTNFLRGSVFAQYDSRDFPGGPRKGSNYIARYTAFSDRDLRLHSFGRLDLEAQRYFPFFNERRVIALRGKTVMTFREGDQAVPFYLQPTLGGSDDLRGYLPFRFHDDHMMVMNAEYRWESFSGLDMALFVDGGKVFSRRADLDLSDLKASYGFGMRFNVRNAVFLRLDVGFGREGPQVWVKFDNVF